MKPQSYLSALQYFVTRIALAEIAIMAMTGVICWLIGWRTLSTYSDGLVWAGFAVIAFGVYSSFGAAGFNADVRYRYSQTVMPNSIHDRTRQNMLDLAESNAFVIVAGLTGFVTILVGLTLKAFR